MVVMTLPVVLVLVVVVMVVVPMVVGGEGVGVMMVVVRRRFAALHDLEIPAPQALALHGFDLQVIAAQVQAGKLFPQVVKGYTQINQCAQDHVSRDAVECIKKQHFPHQGPFSTPPADPSQPVSPGRSSNSVGASRRPFRYDTPSMLEDRIQLIQSCFRDFLERQYQVTGLELPVEKPPRLEFGDLAFPFPFQLAKVLRKPPAVIAQETVERIGRVPDAARLEARGGYVNVFLDRQDFLLDAWEWIRSPLPEPDSAKVIVEHTNINPNKAAHIGHLRNAVLGDTFVRLCRSLGRQVEVQNYIDNTGVQVADVVVGFHFLRGMSLEDVRQVPEPFDYYCWDLYAEVSAWYEGDAGRLARRNQVLHAIEQGEAPFFELGEHISERIVRAHLATMHRIGVTYDVLPRESEILHLKFWDDAFRLLKERQAIYFAEDGPAKGCWVMQLPGDEGRMDEDKIIVRSNGTVTYVGKDIAYQLWKFGLLNRDFHYLPFHRYEDGHQVWVSSTRSDHPEEPRFGGGSAVYNVIDVRQSYLQRVVMQGLRSLGFDDQADRSVHFSYEMVALSPRCCQELGIPLSPEDQARPYVEVSGRKGLGVKADDLLDKLVEKSLAEVTRRQADLSPEQRLKIARQIAVGALRYFMLKYTRTSVIAFDLEEALSFEGETGPYLQYTVVRANNILRRVGERLPDWSLHGLYAQASGLLQQEPVAGILDDSDLWGLVLDVARIGEVVGQSVETLELSGAARHAFSVAQQFNYFYHRHHVLSESDPVRRDVYIALTDLTRLGLIRLLGLLGIEVPERM